MPRRQKARQGIGTRQGKWCVREVLGHLCDAERIFMYRMLGSAGETRRRSLDSTRTPTCRLARFEGRTLGDLLDEWTVGRDATIALARGFPREAWARRGVANGKAVTTSALAYITLGHVEHHLEVLRDRYGV